MIDLYAWKSANGRRPIIMLEETSTPYNLIPIDPHGGENKKPDYLKISPGGKVPCMVDPNGNFGKPVHLMESAAILLYLAEKTGQFLGNSGDENWNVRQWLFYLATNVSISFSNLNHTRELENQCRELLEILDNHLATNKFFAGDYSIADMMVIGRFGDFRFDFIDLKEYSNLIRWRDQLMARPAVKKAIEMPIS